MNVMRINTQQTSIATELRILFQNYYKRKTNKLCTDQLLNLEN